MLVGVSYCCHSLMVVLSANFSLINIWYSPVGGTVKQVADWLGSDGDMRNYVVQLGVPICRTAALWWTWWSVIFKVEFHIPWCQALLWLHVDSVQKHIVRESFRIHPTPSCCSCLPSLFGPKKGEHSMEWHMDRKDTWLALNQSKAKYLGQTMVPKGSTWALESPGWARAGVKKRKVTTGSSWSLSNLLLPSHPWQTMLSFTQLPSPPHLVAKASLRMANDALEWCKQWLTDWPSPSLVTHCLVWENPSGFTLHRLVAPAICFWAKERGAQHGMTHRQKGHVAKLK